MRFGFFLKESMRAMRRNAAPTFAALATIVVTLIVVGVFIPIVQATRGAADSVRSRVLVDVYMKDGATRAADHRVQRELLALPHVARVVFESKTQAYEAQRKADPAAYALLSSNPLPDTFHVYPDNPSNALLIRSELEPVGPGGIARMLDSSISAVSNHTDDTKKLLE